MAREPIPEPDGTILDRVRDIVAEYGTKTAFTEVHPDPSITPDGKTAEDLTFAALDARSDQIAASLQDLGVEPGDVVTYQLPNWIEFPLVALGVQKAGAVSAPILPEHRGSEVGFITSLCESDVLVIPATFRGFDHVAMVEDLIHGGEIDPEHVFVVGAFDARLDSIQRFEALEDGPAEPPAVNRALDDLEQIIFTSGTTGEPKGVRQTARVGYYQTVQPTEFLGLNDGDTLFAPSPLAHNTGYHYLMRAGLLTGAKVVLFDKWLSDDAIETMAAHDCSFCMGATTFLKDLLDLPNNGDYPLPALEKFVLGGATIPRSVVETAYETFANVTVFAVWGQTENGILTITDHDDPIEKICQTDGYPLPRNELTVRESEDGDEIRNEPGKLFVRGAHQTDGYHRRPDITADSFTADGWFITGDLAILYDDGYISIEGREKDVIIRGGENISAAEVEEHVLAHPAVQEVAVVAMPDERLQERPCAYVRLVADYEPSDLTVEDLSSFLADRGIQVQKHPERIEFIEAFPRTSTGKIQKFELREDIADKLDADPV